MLSVENLSVSYGRHQVLYGISFPVKSGEWLMITGPNGAGKSTMLEAIMQNVPYTGAITLRGQNVRQFSPRSRARQMGMLAQRYAPGYDFTVEEIVSLGRYAWHDALGGLSREDEDAVETALEQTGMSALRHHPISRISGGEVQRAFLSQLFAQNPSILLLDEPSSHLDLTYQKQIFELIQSWLSQGERAVISVVHDLSLAKKFGSRVILLHQGCAEIDDSPKRALSPHMLEKVYGMDVYAWMRNLYGEWAE